MDILETIFVWVAFFDMFMVLVLFITHPWKMICNYFMATIASYFIGSVLCYVVSILPFGIGEFLVSRLFSDTAIMIYALVIYGIVGYVTLNNARDFGILPAVVGFASGKPTSSSYTASTGGSPWVAAPSKSSSKRRDDTWERTQRRNEAVFQRTQANQAAYYNANSYEAQRRNNIANQAEWNARL